MEEKDSFRSKSINGLVSNISQERRKNWLIELVDRDSKRDFSFVDRSRWQSRYLLCRRIFPLLPPFAPI